MTILLDVILPVFLLIGVGYLAAWTKYFNDISVDSLMGFAQNVAVPVLLFVSVARLDLAASFDPKLWIAFYSGAFVSFLLGWLVSERLLGRSPEEAVAIGFVCLFGNVLLLALPLTTRAYGPDAIGGNLAILSIHSPLLYMLGITVMEFVRTRGQSLSVGRVALRALSGVLRTPLIIGILCGLAVNVLSGFGFVLLPAIWATADMIAAAALPTALFALGGVLFRYRPEGDATAIALCCVCSVIIHPTVTYGLSWLLDLSPPAMRSAVISASAPPGMNAFMFASIYGAARRVAASTVLVSTAVSIVTIWFWLSVLP